MSMRYQGTSATNLTCDKITIFSAIHATVFLWPAMCATNTHIIFMDEQWFTVQVFWTIYWVKLLSTHKFFPTDFRHVLSSSSWIVQNEDSSLINTHWMRYETVSNASLGIACLVCVLFPYSRCMTGHKPSSTDTTLTPQPAENSQYAAYSPLPSLLSPSKIFKPQNML